MKVWWITLRWAGMKVQNGCKNPAIVHGKVRGNVEKQWMKNSNKNEEQNEWRTTTTKWRTTSTNITKTSLEILPIKVTSLGAFVLQLQNWFRSVINITSISDIVLHMVKISTFNKNNGWCWRHIKRWWLFWWCCWNTKRKALSNIKNEKN